MKKLLLVFVVLLFSCGGEDESPCPDGGSMLGAEGVEQWCAISDGYGGWIAHGQYRQWGKAGYLETEGFYCRGSMCGVWSSWSDRNEKVSEKRYTDEGEPCGTWYQWSDGDLIAEEDHGPC